MVHVVSWAGSILSGEDCVDYKYAVNTFNDEKEKTLTTNFLMNIFIPNVVFLFVHMIAKNYKLYLILENQWMIVAGYYFYRWFLIVFLLRRKEMYSILYEISMIFFGVSICCFLSHFFLTTATTIFVTADELRGELWLAILVIIYNFCKIVFDKVLSYDNIMTKEQKKRYLIKRFNCLYKKYSNNIHVTLENRCFAILFYSLMIWEDYNRGPIIRFLERFLLRTGIKKEATIGIMQYKTDKVISDEESVCLSFEKLLNSLSSDNLENRNVLENIAWQYNNSTDYVNNVMIIYDVLYEYIDYIPKYRNAFYLRNNINNVNEIQEDSKLHIDTLKDLKNIKSNTTIYLNSYRPFVFELSTFVSEHVVVSMENDEILVQIKKLENVNLYLNNAVDVCKNNGKIRVRFDDCTNIYINYMQIVFEHDSSLSLEFYDCNQIALEHFLLIGNITISIVNSKNISCNNITSEKLYM